VKLFRHGVSARTFSHLDRFAFWQVSGWPAKRQGKAAFYKVLKALHD